MQNIDKGLFFLVLSLCCIYLVLDELYGKKIITNFVIKIIPDAEK